MEPLSPAVARFAETYLYSLEDLKVLILLVEERERWHDVASVARKLDIPRDMSRATIDHLTRSNLLDIRITDDVRYRFRPGTSELERHAVAAVDAYRRTPARILQLIGA